MTAGQAAANTIRNLVDEFHRGGGFQVTQFENVAARVERLVKRDWDAPEAGAPQEPELIWEEHRARVSALTLPQPSWHDLTEDDRASIAVVLERAEAKAAPQPERVDPLHLAALLSRLQDAAYDQGYAASGREDAEQPRREWWRRYGGCWRLPMLDRNYVQAVHRQCRDGDADQQDAANVIMALLLEADSLSRAADAIADTFARTEAGWKAERTALISESNARRAREQSALREAWDDCQGALVRISELLDLRIRGYGSTTNGELLEIAQKALEMREETAAPEERQT